MWLLIIDFPLRASEEHIDMSYIHTAPKIHDRHSQVRPFFNQLNFLITLNSDKNAVELKVIDVFFKYIFVLILNETAYAI